MASIPCTIRHTTLTEIVNGVSYTGTVDKDGFAISSVQGEVNANIPDERFYFCSNCLKKFPGDTTFDDCKNHYGTFPLTS